MRKVCFLLPVVLTATVYSMVSASNSTFDEQLSQCRKHMKQSCIQIVNITGKKIDHKEFKEAGTKALKEVRLARSGWLNVIEDFGTNPPIPYQNDPQFPKRLIEIKANFDEMERALEKDSLPIAFKVCAANCGLFVKLHEANGQVFASDKLFHFRKCAKLISELIATKHYEALTPRLLELTSKRDIALIAPVPVTIVTEEGREEYLTLLRQFSQAVDGFVIMATNGRYEELGAKYEKMMDVFNKVYFLSI